MLDWLAMLLKLLGFEVPVATKDELLTGPLLLAQAKLKSVIGTSSYGDISEILGLFYGIFSWYISWKALKPDTNFKSLIFYTKLGQIK